MTDMADLGKMNDMTEGSGRSDLNLGTDMCGETGPGMAAGMSGLLVVTGSEDTGTDAEMGTGSGMKAGGWVTRTGCEEVTGMKLPVTEIGKVSEVKEMQETCAAGVASFDTAAAAVAMTDSDRATIH